MLTQTEERWIDSLVPYVKDHIGAGKSEQVAIRLAIEDLRTITAEMTLQKTRRSKRAAKAIMIRTYLGLVQSASVSGLLANQEIAQ